MISINIARKWVALLGLGFHPDNSGEDYAPTMPPDMQAAYDCDMRALFASADDPYAIVLDEMKLAELIP